MGNARVVGQTAVVATLSVLAGCVYLPSPALSRASVSQTLDKFTGDEKIEFDWLYLGQSNGVHVNMRLFWVSSAPGRTANIQFRMGASRCPASYDSALLMLADGERAELAKLKYRHGNIDAFAGGGHVATVCIGYLYGDISMDKLARAADASSVDLRVGQAELPLLPNHRKVIKDFLSHIPPQANPAPTESAATGNLQSL